VVFRVAVFRFDTLTVDQFYTVGLKLNVCFYSIRYDRGSRV